MGHEGLLLRGWSLTGIQRAQASDVNVGIILQAAMSEKDNINISEEKY